MERLMHTAPSQNLKHSRAIQLIQLREKFE